MTETLMKVILILNFKGGCGKTSVSVNIAYVLAVLLGFKVLLIDLDKQGDTSKTYAVHSYDKPSVADIFTRKKKIRSVIRRTKYKNLDVVPANMHLLTANLELISNQEVEQKLILKEELEEIKQDYDFCIIDGPPDINMSVINAIVAADDVIVPVKIDGHSFDGMNELEIQLKNIHKHNPKFKTMKCLVTMYYKSRKKKGEDTVGVCDQGIEWLRKQKYPLFKTVIRRTEKADENTFMSIPLVEYSPRCGASRNYKEFVNEYLENEG